jgi:hypothetical protein
MPTQLQTQDVWDTELGSFYDHWLDDVKPYAQNAATYNRPALEESHIFFRPKVPKLTRFSFFGYARFDGIKLPALGGYSEGLRHIRQALENEGEIEPYTSEDEDQIIKPPKRQVIGNQVFDVAKLYIDMGGAEFIDTPITDLYEYTFSGVDYTYTLEFKPIRTQDKSELLVISISTVDAESSEFFDQGWSASPFQIRQTQWTLPGYEGDKPPGFPSFYYDLFRSLYHRYVRDAGALKYQVCFKTVNDNDKDTITLLFDWTLNTTQLESENPRDSFNKSFTNGAAKAFVIPYIHSRCKITADGFFSTTSTINMLGGLSPAGLDPFVPGKCSISNGIGSYKSVDSFGVGGYAVNAADDKFVQYDESVFYEREAVSKTFYGVMYSYFEYDPTGGMFGAGAFVEKTESPKDDGGFRFTVIETTDIGTGEGRVVLTIRKNVSGSWILWQSASYQKVHDINLSAYLTCSGGTLTGSVPLDKVGETLFDAGATPLPDTISLIYGVHKDPILTRALIPITRTMTQFFSSEGYKWIGRKVGGDPYDLMEFFEFPNRLAASDLSGITFPEISETTSVKFALNDGAIFPKFNADNFGRKTLRINTDPFPLPLPAKDDDDYDLLFLDPLRTGTTFKNVEFVISAVDAQLIIQTSASVADYPDEKVTFSLNTIAKYEFGIDAFSAKSPITISNIFVDEDDLDGTTFLGVGGTIKLTPIEVLP